MNACDKYTIYFCNTKVENQWVDGVTGTRAAEARQRWLDFQEEYGVEITYIADTYGNDWVNQVPAAAAAGTPVADIFNMGGPCFIPMCINVNGVVATNIYANLAEYSEYTDFDNGAYWDQSATEAVGYYNGAHLIVVPQESGIGAAALNMVTYFNKDLLAAGGHSAEEVYKLYKDGDWTFDKFRQMCIDCTDLDKGVYGVTNTRNYLSVYSLICANGGSVLTNNEETGAPEFTANSEAGLEAVNFFIKLAKEDNVVLLENGYWQEEAPFFRDGKSTFMLTYANRAWENEASGTAIFQNETIKYGIVLPPKGPKATDYRSDKNWYVPFAVFKGHSNMAGVVQCMSLFCRPEYAADSTEAMMLLEADANTYFQDNDSIQVLKDVISKNVTTSYMAYWDFGPNGVGHLTTLPMDKWISGESTPEVDYAAGKDALDKFLAEQLGITA